MVSEKAGPEGRIAIAALTGEGVRLARGLAAELPGSILFAPHRHASEGTIAFNRLGDFVGENWGRFQAHVFIMAAGIVVRHIAPLMAHKSTDPAVVVMDERGRFAVSLLSGHLGGANDLARKLARITGGQAVITTASDVRGMPALDLIAQSAGLEIENITALSRVALALLEEEIWLVDPHELVYPQLAKAPNVRIVPWEDARACGEIIDHAPPAAFTHTNSTSRPICSNTLRGPGVWVSEFLPPAGLECLVLRPRNLVVGIGCNRGTPAGEILDLIREIFRRERLSPLSIRNLASVDLKSNEAGLLEAAKALGRPIQFFSRPDLDQIEVLNPSATVQKHIGIQSVCEAAALLSARGTVLLVPKHKTPNVTLALTRVGSP